MSTKFQAGRRLIEEYYQSLVHLVTHTRLVRAHEIALGARSEHTAFIRGDLYFTDNSRLHFRELVKLEDEVKRLMYVYHYQRADAVLIFRYDNTDHPTLFPAHSHHKHDGSQANMIAVEPPDLDLCFKRLNG